MGRGRSYRRAQYARRKNYVRKYLQRYHDGAREIPGCTQELLLERAVAFAANTPHRCSCWCCGNERRKWGKESLTMQEKRAAIAD